MFLMNCDFISESKPTTYFRVCTINCNSRIRPVFCSGGDTEENSVSEGGMQGNYRATSLHFHWGSNDTLGSEHTVNSQQYPMEVSASFKHALSLS